MSCCKTLLRATNVAVSNAGLATITVEDDSITGLTEREIIEIGLFTSIPMTRSCNQIRITDGTTTINVYSRNQYWRPAMLKCRSILVLEYLSDPELFVIRDVNGRGCI